MGFNELGRAVGGCNPATLKLRLERLEEQGVVIRTVHSYMPPRTSYELAPAGVDLQRVIAAIDGWGREHLAQPSVARARAGDPRGPEARRRLSAATPASRTPRSGRRRRGRWLR